MVDKISQIVSLIKPVSRTISPKLGQDLTPIEERTYRVIDQDGPIGQEDIYEKVHKRKPNSDDQTISVVVSRIRKKLGEQAVGNTSDGYVTRRSLISRLVNSKQEK